MKESPQVNHHKPRQITVLLTLGCSRAQTASYSHVCQEDYWICHLVDIKKKKKRCKIDDLV